jgi:3-oxoadipate enol-lactonase
MTMHFIQRDSVRLAYELRGPVDGPLIALIQGLGLAGRMWLDLPHGLTRMGYRVVIPDNRGTGASDAPWPPYAITTMADDAAAVLEDVGRGPALVVGISMGGMLAQQLYLRHPQRVRALVLAASTCGLPYGKLPSMRFVKVVLDSILCDPATCMDEMHRMLVHERTLTRNPRLFRRWDREMARCPVGWRGMTGQMAAASAHSTGALLPQIRCPTVVVAGEDDQVIPPENSRILAKHIPDAELVMLPQAGHAFPLEHPRAIPEAVARLEERLDCAGSLSQVS